MRRFLADRKYLHTFCHRITKWTAPLYNNISFNKKHIKYFLGIARVLFANLGGGQPGGGAGPGECCPVRRAFSRPVVVSAADVLQRT